MSPVSLAVHAWLLCGIAGVALAMTIYRLEIDSWPDDRGSYVGSFFVVMSGPIILIGALVLTLEHLKRRLSK